VTRVLVTGAGGFVGLPLLERLGGEGREVHALCTRAPAVAAPAWVHWHRLDLFDAHALDALIGELAPDQLVHLAWCTEHGRFWRAQENVEWVAHSLALVRAFVRCGGRRLVMAGTCAEYDWSAVGSRALVEASSPLVPATLYGTAKDALRRVASAYAQQEQVELAWARLFFPYGPREARGRLVPSLIRSLLARQPAATGAGERARDFMYVEDVAGALAALLDSSVTGPVNIASGVRVTVAQLAKEVGRLTGHPGLLHVGALRDREPEPPLLLADVTRLREEVGYRPRWTLAEGLATTVRWWREHGLVDRAPRPSRAVRAPLRRPSC
jgi:nucleoside-diphosphate-sugar epimerase